MNAHQKRRSVLEIAAISFNKIMTVVNEQANDPGLWVMPLPGFPQSIVEAYLQQALRRLHRAIEEGDIGKNPNGHEE